MKGIYGILVLFIVALFVGACTSEQQPEVQDNQEELTPPEQVPGINGEEEPEQKDEVTSNGEAPEQGVGGEIPMTEIYDYASVTQFIYESTSTANGETFKSTMDYSLSSDTVDGKAAWLSMAEVETQGMVVLSKVWTDKVTYGCLKMTSVITFNGQEMETPAECPKEGPNAATTATQTPMVTYLGDEIVTVPLGTFNTKKYSLDNTITYYYASGVPIPVKVTYADVDTVMELVNWS